jgi:chromosome segregation ATPase
LRKEKDKLDARIKKIEDNILGESKDELKQLKDALKKAEDDCKKEKLTLKNSSTTIQRIRRNIDNAEQAIREAHDELMKANTNIAKFKADYELRLNQKVEYEQRLAETTAAIEESTTELTRLGTQESEFSHLLGEQQQNLRVAEGRMSTYLEKLSEVETEVFTYFLLGRDELMVFV